MTSSVEPTILVIFGSMGDPTWRKPAPALFNLMLGDATLFMRADQVEASWSVLKPTLEVWAGRKPVDFPNYSSGAWGPDAADGLLAADGRSWLQPENRYGSL